MPQFEPGESKTATATFINPKSAGFDYSASLCMGTGWTEMASASFYLNAGQSKAIALPVTMPATPGTYPVYFKVTCGGVLIGTFAATEDVVIALTKYVFYYTNPNRSAATHWTVGEILATGAPVPLAQAITLEPSAKRVALNFWEFINQTDPVSYGPFLVNTGNPGEYLWNAKLKKMNDVSCPDMPNVSNKCLVGGIMTGVTMDPYIGGSFYMAFQESLNYSGQNWGVYWIGRAVQVKSDSIIGLMGGYTGSGLNVHVQALCSLKPHDVLGYVWEAEWVRAYQEYPASAYLFNFQKGTKTVTETVYTPVGYPRPSGGYCLLYPGCYDTVSKNIPVVTITGNVPSFSIVALILEGTYVHVKQKELGPVTSWEPPYIPGLSTQIWCHPDPTRAFPGSERLAVFDNWVMVGVYV